MKTLNYKIPQPERGPGGRFVKNRQPMPSSAPKALRIDSRPLPATLVALIVLAPFIGGLVGGGCHYAFAPQVDRAAEAGECADLPLQTSVQYAAPGCSTPGQSEGVQPAGRTDVD